MTAADIAPWASPALILVLFAWLRSDLGRRIDQIDKRMDRLETRIDALHERLRSLETVVAAMAAKVDLLEHYFLRRNDPDSDPPPVAAE